MREHRIDHPHNEASALLSIHNQRLLDAFGWDVAFWAASDEAPAHKAIGVLGRRRDRLDELGDRRVIESDGAPGAPWELVRCKAKRSKRSTRLETDDSEAMARAGAWIYLFGSHFGSKEGPLDPARHFVARFNESLVEIEEDRVKVKLEVARPEFELHRAVNDALQHRAIDLLPEGRHVLDDYIRRTMAEASKGGGGSPAAPRVAFGDVPINVEGVTFLPSGRVLLGLRYPVTAEGHPICVEVDGIDRVFETKKRERFGRLHATRVFSLRGVGSRDRPAGIRALEQWGREVHAITGDLDSDPDESRVLADHPEGAHAVNEHHVFEMPVGDEAEVATRRIRAFERDDNVEGLVISLDGATWYAHDADIIRLDEYPLGQ